MKPHLPPRQKEIIRLISLGCSNSEIAAILDLSTATVDNHKARLMETLGTDKSVLVTRLALKYRFTSSKDKLTAREKRRSGRKNDGWN